jgi:trk system potassium uptake protein TrkA
MKIVIPSGTDRLHLGDEITLVGTPNGLEKSEPMLGQTTPEAKSIVIFGGGLVGETLARLLEPWACQVMLIERDTDRAKALSESLPQATVICGDGTQIEVLREERVGSADVFVATTGEDEENIMATQLAREMGVPQSIVLIHRPDYASIIQRMGFDHVLSPRVVTARHVMDHLQEDTVHGTQVLGGGAEIMEIVAGPRAAATKGSLRDVKFPRGSLICAIIRDGEMRIAHGDDVIEPGSTVIAIAERKAIRDLRSKLV